jgi:hypothetical protein
MCKVDHGPDGARRKGIENIGCGAMFAQKMYLLN